MGILDKIWLLTESGKYDSCGPKSCEVKITKGLGGIYNAKSERKDCTLFKTLMTNSCNLDCKYCSNPKCKNKVSYEPEELAGIFMNLARNYDVHGLFLSSGVAGDPDKISERMLKAVRLLRFKYKFGGYIHFKILPGTSREIIKQASEIANRLSINIEAPNSSTLSELSTCKDFKIDLLRRQAWISKFSKNQTTQMIVSNHSTDKDILKMMKWEYEKLKLKRVYFSAFRPVKGTELENEPAVSNTRENHLYNSDFLIRKYGYSFKEFDSILEGGMLPSQDPKLAMAKENFNSVDVNEASYEQLIRVPGIGLKGAKKIIQQRKKENIKSWGRLSKLGVVQKRAGAFLKVNGYRQKMLGEF
jgi:predicted DNA-binding helix-hairpin-helix protein